jgi:hypothetical protein
MKLSLPLYDPPVVEINGRAYPLRPINRPMFRKLREIDEKSAQSTDPYDDVEAGYEVLMVCLDAPAEVLDVLPISQVREISNFIRSVIMAGKDGDQVKAAEPAKALTPEEKDEAEKNGLKPGEGTAAV